jgi:hypothetical protein
LAPEWREIVGFGMDIIAHRGIAGGAGYASMQVGQNRPESAADRQGIERDRKMEF